LNLKSFAVRSVVAIIFGPLIILAFLIGKYFLLGLSLLIVLLSLYEYFNLVKLKNAYGQTAIAMISGSAIVLSLYFTGERLFIPILILTFIIIFFIELYRKNGSPFLNTAVTLFGIIYYALMFGCWILVRQISDSYPRFDYHIAGKWIILIIATTWVCDTAAYLLGSFFGRHKLMERISPKKTVEGAVAGIIFAMLTAYVCHKTFVEGLRLVDSMALGALVGIMSQYGDLFESLLKRDAGVKDSSSIIPGHGGIMDRFDSLTILAPLVYLYLKVFVL
jgi:phosphatidate cytidylyltransferase